MTIYYYNNIVVRTEHKHTLTHRVRSNFNVTRTRVEKRLEGSALLCTYVLFIHTTYACTQNVCAHVHNVVYTCTSSVGRLPAKYHCGDYNDVHNIVHTYLRAVQYTKQHNSIGFGGGGDDGARRTTQHAHTVALYT